MRGITWQSAAEYGLAASGVELNPFAAARVRALGFEVFEAGLAEVAQQLKAPFDAVCAFQVLEHVSDPRGFPEGLLVLLRPGGRLILSVPNAAVMRVIDPQRVGLLDQPPHHMSHWDEGVFRSLERLLPLRVVEVRREPLAPYHIDWFVSSYAGILRHRWRHALGSLVLNRLFRSLIRWLLAHGGRFLVPGHTLLVVFDHRK